jgi:hypothetical protein
MDLRLLPVGLLVLGSLVVVITTIAVVGGFYSPTFNPATGPVSPAEGPTDSPSGIPAAPTDIDASDLQIPTEAPALVASALLLLIAAWAVYRTPPW